MSSEPVAIKVEPPDDFTLEDKSASPVFAENGEPDNSKETPASSSSHDMRNFTCLLCEVICENRDDLRRHLKTYHASKHGTFNSYVNNLISPEAAIAGLSTYMNYRYTCALCGAKFRTLRSYLSHNMSHRSIGSSRSQFEDSGMASILNSGKQYLQEYFDSDDGYPGTFTCNECNTVFTQRDSYAMHMMMRAMNETCQHVAPVSPAKSEKTEPEDEITITSKTPGNDVIPSPTDPNSKQQDITVNVQQKCLEDVTSSVDQDEYLKSVLDKVLTTEEPKPDSHIPSPRHQNNDRKMCKFCGGSFLDQDSLAMHVMSDHSQEMTGPNSRSDNRSAKYLKYSSWLSQNQALVLNYNCKYCGETFMSRDSLAMHVLTHAHQDNKKSDFLAHNSLKRPRDYDHESLITASQRTKILRRVGQFNHLSFRQKRDDSHNTQAGQRESERLYCVKCNITFYLRTEYDWHVRNYHGTTDADTETDDAQPLCLTKPSAKQRTDGALSSNKENDVVTDTVAHVPKSPKPRRNSFSYDKSSRNRDLAPKRPLSADDCTNLKNGSPNNAKGHAKSSSLYINRSNKLPNDFVPNLNALSTNEQRIIFSVFGKDLNFNKINENNKRLDDSSSTSEDSCNDDHNTREDAQSQPADLTVSKSPATSTSGDTLCSEATSATGNAADIVVANGQDGRQDMLNSDLDAPMCKYCDIVFFNKAIYYLHMGLHNVNNPWQCNICGKCCTDAVDFAAHVIHM